MKTSQYLKKFKYQMKKNKTKSESIFYERLVNYGVNFKNQMILGMFILDFVIPERMLVIEIDGCIHDNRKEYDNNRDNFISQCGFKVLRIKNENVSLFDLSLINNYDLVDIKYFRSGLAKANSLKSKIIRNRRAGDILRFESKETVPVTV